MLLVNNVRLLTYRIHCLYDVSHLQTLHFNKINKLMRVNQFFKVFFSMRSVGILHPNALDTLLFIYLCDIVCIYLPSIFLLSDWQMQLFWACTSTFFIIFIDKSKFPYSNVVTLLLPTLEILITNLLDFDILNVNVYFKIAVPQIQM